MSKANVKISKGEQVADAIISHYYDGMNAGSDFICDITTDFTKEIDALHAKINRLKTTNKNLRAKNKTLVVALEVYKKFDSSLPFSIKEFNNV